MPTRPAFDADPRVLRRHLRELREDLLRHGGVEIVTPEHGPEAPRIRSVVQLDGDIISEVDLSGSAEACARAIDAHCAQLATYVRRMRRSMVWTRRGIAGTLTVVLPIVASVLWATVLPMVALAASAGAGAVRWIAAINRALAVVGAVALGVGTAFAWSRSWLDGVREVLLFWALAGAWVLVAAGVGWMVGRIIRQRLGV